MEREKIAVENEFSKDCGGWALGNQDALRKFLSRFQVSFVIRETENLRNLNCFLLYVFKTKQFLADFLVENIQSLISKAKEAVL